MVHDYIKIYSQKHKTILTFMITYLVMLQLNMVPCAQVETFEVMLKLECAKDRKWLAFFCEPKIKVDQPLIH